MTPIARPTGTFDFLIKNNRLHVIAVLVRKILARLPLSNSKTLSVSGWIVGSMIVERLVDGQFPPLLIKGVMAGGMAAGGVFSHGTLVLQGLAAVVVISCQSNCWVRGVYVMPVNLPWHYTFIF